MQVDMPEGNITDYERAVCYYTLPKINSPVTFGLIAAYALCVVEAAAAFAYGLIVRDPSWVFVGKAALVSIIVFGMAAFLLRALWNDWNRRLALAAARDVPDAREDSDVPNPFESHVLLRRPVAVRSEVFACVTKSGDIEYYVEVRRPKSRWRVSSPQNEPLFDVAALPGVAPFVFAAPLPARAGVYVDKQEAASIVRHAGFQASKVHVFSLAPNEKHYTIQNGCIYSAERLVGRIYTLRRVLYLDIAQEHAVPGIIAYFIMLI